MSSSIYIDNINENFPVAGQDNDTQVFRDNFTGIKTALSVAKNEIGDLQDNVVRIDSSNNLNGSLLENVITQNISEVIVPATLPISSSTLPIEFQTSSYQIFKLGTHVSCEFSQFPSTEAAVGKVTLELYSSDSIVRKITFSASGAVVFKKHGFPALVEAGSHDLEVSSSTNPVIIEIWRHSPDKFYVNYLGLFE